ncbi:MAG TPA: class 1 fructose-bisphosphatase [Pseudolabrys sp.]|jgi:fructose-1,6-bisphosphatase|nr:class 1 fructose-bisphosphatase [Pseudolabrys sp.]
MPRRGQTVTEVFREEQSCVPSLDADLIALIEHLQNAFKSIASITAQGVLDCYTGHSVGINIQGEEQKLLDTLTNDIIIGACEESGTLCGIASEEMEDVYEVPKWFGSGPYLLVCDPLDGSSNIDVNVTIGSIFSVLRAPKGTTEPTVDAFLQPGTQQVAAGYALYGPAAMLVMTLGHGVHGFTFNRELAAYVLTHPHMRIPETACEFAINASNERFWEQPVHRYVTECLQGKAGPRAVDFNMRWIASLVAEVHRILIRGGVYMYPRDSKDPTKAGRLRLLYEANPMAMLIEQAGGAASTGRERILSVEPDSLHQRIPLILGCKAEVDRLVRYHASFDTGDTTVLEAPLFNVRSLFRTA